jgi:hypothetical protein
MKIALLISGRMKRYEVCLLEFLKNNLNYNIDLFVSINDNDGNYYDTMKETLKYWLKDSYIKPYVLPEDFNHTHPFKQENILQNNKLVPFYHMSMFFNDANAFNLAYNYSINNNIKYDVYMKYRADIINTKMCDLSDFKDDILYTIPYCNFISKSLYKKQCVGAAWDYGSYDVMKLYCKTYEYILSKLKELNGNYRIAYECSLTDNCYDKNLNIKYYLEGNYYEIDKYRRIDDTYNRSPFMSIEEYNEIKNKINNNNNIIIDAIKQ